MLIEYKGNPLQSGAKNFLTLIALSNRRHEIHFLRHWVSWYSSIERRRLQFMLLSVQQLFFSQQEDIQGLRDLTSEIFVCSLLCARCDRTRLRTTKQPIWQCSTSSLKDLQGWSVALTCYWHLLHSFIHLFSKKVHFWPFENELANSFFRVMNRHNENQMRTRSRERESATIEHDDGKQLVSHWWISSSLCCHWTSNKCSEGIFVVTVRIFSRVWTQSWSRSHWTPNGERDNARHSSSLK